MAIATQRRESAPACPCDCSSTTERELLRLTLPAPRRYRRLPTRPGAYIVRVDDAGNVSSVDQLPADTLLIDGERWNRLFEAFRGATPMEAL